MIRRFRSRLTFWLTILALSNARSLAVQSIDPLEMRGEVPQKESDAEGQSPEFTMRNYYVSSRSTGTRRETEPPRYVRNLGDVEWLNRSEAPLPGAMPGNATQHHDFQKPCQSKCGKCSATLCMFVLL